MDYGLERLCVKKSNYREPYLKASQIQRVSKYPNLSEQNPRYLTEVCDYSPILSFALCSITIYLHPNVR